MTTEDKTEKLDFKRVLPVLVIVLVDLIGLSVIIPLLPLYAARFGSSPMVIGILQATYPFMQFIGAPILGRLSDQFGRKPVLIASQIGTLAGFILLGFAIQSSCFLSPVSLTVSLAPTSPLLKPPLPTAQMKRHAPRAWD